MPRDLRLEASHLESVTPRCVSRLNVEKEINDAVKMSTPELNSHREVMEEHWVVARIEWVHLRLGKNEIL